MDLLQKIDGWYVKRCKQCLSVMKRRKKSEASRVNWLFCSKTCGAVHNNKSRTQTEDRFCGNCGSSFGVNTTNTVSARKRFCSSRCAITHRNDQNNPSVSPQAREKIAIAAKKRGTSHMRTDQAREKQRISISGSGHWNWQGGITPENRRRRNLKEYKDCRKLVFARDNFTCLLCGKRGGYLEMDHIKPWAYFPELRYALSNLRTLCKPCHKETDTYMGRAYKHRITQAP
jgi:hypothetical protein